MNASASLQTEPPSSCIVEDCLKCPFRKLTVGEQLKIVEKGKPTPELPLLKQFKNNRKTPRCFHSRMYDYFPWMCGCEHLSKLFCWSCLLFNDANTVWKTGVDDLHNIYRMGKRHTGSFGHIVAAKALTQFGKASNMDNFNELSGFVIEKHNEIVKKNRRTMGHLIDTACIVARLELPFRGDDELQTSLNRGNYVELLNMVSRYDLELETHLEKSTALSGKSRDVQNGIIHSIGEYMINKIQLEISEAPFVALILDETSDISSQSRLAPILRYVTKEGSVEEKFLGFTDIGADRTANALFAKATEILTMFDCESKLVAQTYNGAAVITGEHNPLQEKFKQRYERAIFVHYHAHDLNLMLIQSVSFIKECKVFFSILSGIGRFFSESTTRSGALDVEVKKNFPDLAPTKWNDNSRLVEIVNAYYQEIANVFQSMVDNAEQWDSETICCAQGLRDQMLQFDFKFLMTIFSQIFPHTEKLFEILHNNLCSLSLCGTKIDELKIFLQKYSTEFNKIWIEANTNHINVSPPIHKRIKTENGECYPKILFIQILDTITNTISERFNDVSKLDFLNLLEKTLFPGFIRQFPEILLSSLMQDFSSLFDFVSLKGELRVIYSQQDMHKISVRAFNQYVMSEGLVNIFPEAFRLSLLILTFPITSASAEISPIQRIERYLRNTRNQQVSSQALLSIEQLTLEKRMKDSSFHEDVIEIFATRSSGIELRYKK